MQDVYLGVLLDSSPVEGRGRNQYGKREKSSCDAGTVIASTDRIENGGAKPN